MSGNLFAKTFDKTRYGQVLVVLDEGDDAAPELRFFANLNGGALSAIAIPFESSVTGWKHAQTEFSRVDEGIATRAIESLIAAVDEVEKTTAK